MNRIQFWSLIGLSSLIVVLLFAHIFLVRQATLYQNAINQAQQIINQGQSARSISLQLAQRIYQDSQKTQDPGLKALLDRQQITFTPSTNSENGSAPEAPAPSTTPTTR